IGRELDQWFYEEFVDCYSDLRVYTSREKKLRRIFQELTRRAKERRGRVLVYVTDERKSSNKVRIEKGKQEIR
ncbi:hypothetical protein, partial [Emergencia sp. 1XD21-10]|uniref:hypothetical protein n=1 Tax=Emergencia sp. 1XD21-10 TaxID=2304569 RepID=UPI00137976C1